MNYEDTLSAISSPGSADGVMPSSSPDGRSSDPCGLEAAHANRLVRLEKDWERLTRDTCGQTSETSLRSVALQSSLASKLRARLGCNGSMEYALTWKERVTPLGRRICALRASARRTSDNDFTGWPTPRANDGTGAQECPGRTGGPALKQVAQMAGWATPKSRDHHIEGKGQYSASLARMAGWATPTSRDHKDGGSVGTAPTNCLLGRQVWLAENKEVAGWATPTANKLTPQSRDNKCLARDAVLLAGSKEQVEELKQWAPPGMVLNSSLAPTENRGALNPAHSRWLMGFPVAWDSCGATAMQSFRRKPRRSSKRG